MSRPVLADTGPLYALADPSDQYHARARRELDRLIERDFQVAVAFSTLGEAYTLVMRRLGVEYAINWLGELLDGSLLVNPEPADYQAAVALIAGRPDKPLTIFDAVAAVVSARLNCAAWTFDRHFDDIGATRWK
jgi:predicted nucleic acid-binding protein